MEFQNVFEELNEKFHKLSKWKEDLKKILTEKKNLENEIYLIKKEWLNEFEENFHNINNNINENKNIEINKYHLEFNLKQNIRLFPEVFPLDNNSWQLFNKSDDINNVNDDNDADDEYIYYKGSFFNNLLLPEIKEYSNSKLYCFFFFDNNSFLRQAYLLINNLDNEKKILNEFKKEEFKKIMIKKNITLTPYDSFYHSPKLDYDLYILTYKKKNNANNIKNKNINDKKNNSKEKL